MNMNTRNIISAAAAAFLALGASAQDAPKVAVHGFVRNYWTLDSRECVSGTEDFFMYMPRDTKEVSGEDLFAQPTSTFGAITSRFWLDVTDYTVNSWKVGGRIEADFYLGLSAATMNTGSGHTVTGAASTRLRQAYFTLAKGNTSFKVGQAWHPIAADMPDNFSLNVGAPFGPFSRTPMISYDQKLSSTLTANLTALYQMQYTSTGPLGASSIYQTYSLLPEMYTGLTYASGPFTTKVGAGVLHIRPRVNDGVKKVADHITTGYGMLYLQYKKGDFAVKVKETLAQAGEHIGLNGGYGVSDIVSDGSFVYTPTRNYNHWASISYGKTYQVVLFTGYMKNLGTKKELLGAFGKPANYFFNKNGFDNINSMYRIAPNFMYNMGKLQFGAEYELTSVKYGDKTQGMNLQNGLYEQGLHWVTNHRLQFISKFTF